MLSDPQKRAQYDRFGAIGNGGAPPGDFGFGSGSFGDIFDMFFGNVRGASQPRRTGPERGADLRYDVEITLEDAFHGATKEIAFDRLAHCDACKGSGAKPGTMIVPCERCGGSGIVRSARQTPLGQMVTQMACTRCSGEGHVIAHPCERCGGRGRRESETRLTVNVPPGVEDGSRIRIAGNGEAGMHGGPPGDLYVYLTIAHHAIFKRNARDTFVDVPVELSPSGAGRDAERAVAQRRCGADAAAGNANRHDVASARIRDAERSWQRIAATITSPSTSWFRRNSTSVSASCSKSTRTPGVTRSRSAPSSTG